MVQPITADTLRRGNPRSSPFRMRLQLGHDLSATWGGHPTWRFVLGAQQRGKQTRFLVLGGETLERCDEKLYRSTLRFPQGEQSLRA